MGRRRTQGSASLWVDGLSVFEGPEQRRRASGMYVDLLVIVEMREMMDGGVILWEVG